MYAHKIKMMVFQKWSHGTAWDYRFSVEKEIKTIV
jgi:hypothetical protein